MNIKLYTKNVCPKCMLIKTVLNIAELEYETINIDEDAEAKELIVSKGFMAVPILEVDGEFISEVSQIQAKISELAK